MSLNIDSLPVPAEQPGPHHVPVGLAGSLQVRQPHLAVGATNVHQVVDTGRRPTKLATLLSATISRLRGGGENRPSACLSRVVRGRCAFQSASICHVRPQRPSAEKGNCAQSEGGRSTQALCVAGLCGGGCGHSSPGSALGGPASLEPPPPPPPPGLGHI